MIAVLINRWFRDRVSTVTAIAFAFAGISGALLNPFFSSLILAFGYRAALFVRGGVILLSALPGTIFFMRDDPADVGLPPYAASRPECGIGGVRETLPPATLRPRSWLFFLLAAFMILMSTASRLVDQISGYAESIGQGPRIGALLASSYMIGSVVFKLVVGILNDSIGVIKTTVGACILAMLGILLLIFFPDSVFLILIGAFVCGVTLALASVTIIALVIHVYGKEESGTAMEFLTPLSAVYPPLLTLYGVLYDVTGTYTAVLLSCAGICGSCLVLAIMIESRARRETPARRRPGVQRLKRP